MGLHSPPFTLLEQKWDLESRHNVKRSLVIVCMKFVTKGCFYPVWGRLQPLIFTKTIQSRWWFLGGWMEIQIKPFLLKFLWQYMAHTSTTYDPPKYQKYDKKLSSLVKMIWKISVQLVNVFQRWMQRNHKTLDKKRVPCPIFYFFLKTTIVSKLFIKIYLDSIMSQKHYKHG